MYKNACVRPYAPIAKPIAIPIFSGVLTAPPPKGKVNAYGASTGNTTNSPNIRRANTSASRTLIMRSCALN